jgi:hypothetical protein
MINMMPFVIGEKDSLPREYHSYWPIIKSCPIHKREFGKIGFLSVRESYVQSGNSQSRTGIHTERPNCGQAWGGPWGGVHYPSAKNAKNNKFSGIFMASNTSNSCRIWDALVDKPGHLGDISHLSHLFSKDQSHVMEENTLYWLTDQTPHEALPLKYSQIRQWFRLVTSDVGLWYRRHSTENPLGIKPKCKVIEENKFL